MAQKIMEVFINFICSSIPDQNMARITAPVVSTPVSAMMCPFRQDPRQTLLHFPPFLLCLPVVCPGNYRAHKCKPVGLGGTQAIIWIASSFVINSPAMTFCPIVVKVGFFHSYFI